MCTTVYTNAVLGYLLCAITFYMTVHLVTVYTNAVLGYLLCAITFYMTVHLVTVFTNAVLGYLLCAITFYMTSSCALIFKHELLIQNEPLSFLHSLHVSAPQPACCFVKENRARKKL